MRAPRAIALLFSLGALSAWMGCGGDDETSGTVPTSSSTSGAGGATSATSTSVTTGTTVASTTSGGGESKLGLECQDDSDCGEAGRCILPTDNDEVLGGGPAGGYCTKDCESDSDCDGGSCLTFGSTSECFLDCVIGPSLSFLDDELDANKCHGREDVRCTPVTGEVCVPTCGSDQQCPNGRVCDPRFRVCVDSASASTGKENGDACDPNASTPECAGTCVNFSSGETMCSNACVLGGEIDAYDCGGLTGGLCVFRPTDNGAGDYGFCSPACLQHDECQNPDWWCFGIEGVSGGLVDNGFCFGATPCPNGDECDPAAGDVCTDTKYGAFCLDPAFPLGTAAPDPTGSGGGGGAGGGGTGGAGGSGTGGAGGAGGAGGG